MIQLRPYQHEAVDAVLAAHERGLRRVLVSLPTGTGKTVAFTELLRRRGGRSLILAHRDELISQAAAKVRDVWPEARPGVIKAEQNDVNADVVVASVQTVSRPSRLERLIDAGGFETVVIDEGHHSTADSYRRVLDGVRSFEADGPLTLGVTATAFRSDGESLGDVFEAVVYEAGILPMIEAGYLCDVRAKRIKLEADFGFHLRAGDYAINEVADELMKADAPKHAAGAYLEHAAGRKALVFTPTVEVAHAMAEAFRAQGVACEALDGGTPDDERRAILSRLKSGETAVVSNCAVLTEGFDEPSIDCIVIARPTRSKGLYCQMVGRGTRIHPGKEDMLILDLVGVTGRHDLMTAAKLFDVPDRRLELNESVTEALAGEREEQAALDGRRVAVDVDPFRTRRLLWTPTASGSYALTLGEKGTLFLVPQGERWDVVRATRERAVEKLMTGLSLPYAQGYAEDVARQFKAEILSRRDAPWRRGPASEKQRATLVKWRRWKDGMTKGEASDAISAYVAGKAAWRLEDATMRSGGAAA
ncbi:MAG: DEAD/DEAH box helicase [Vicinamibacteria bacterium]|nr:DEAD/DEAH box helicase [Vicinamibacteria bacterium]